VFGFGKSLTYQSDVQSDIAFSPDQQTFTLRFGNLQVAVRGGPVTGPSPEAPPVATRLFYLALPLDEGGKEAEITFVVQGAVVTVEGATATMVFSVNGQTFVTDFPPAPDEAFVKEFKFKSATAPECRLSVFLLAGRDAKNSNAEAFLNVTAIDATIQSSKKYRA